MFVNPVTIVRYKLVCEKLLFLEETVQIILIKNLHRIFVMGHRPLSKIGSVSDLVKIILLSEIPDAGKSIQLKIFHIRIRQSDCYYL